MTIMDAIIIFLMLFFFYSGWQKGIGQALISPACFFVCGLYGLLIFDLSFNILKTIVVILSGTVVLSGLIKIFLMIGHSSTDKRYRKHRFWGSRVSGALINLTYRGSITVLFFCLLPLIPIRQAKVISLQEEITQTHTYQLTQTYLISKISPVQNLQETLATFNDPEELKKFASSTEFQEFLSDPQIQDIVQDKEIRKFLQEKNISDLIFHPKIKKIFSDEKLMKKITLMGKKVYEEKTIEAKKKKGKETSE